MNQNYGKLVNGAIVYAPSSLNTPGGMILNPKRLSYLQAGWKFLDLQPPADPPPEGKEYTITGYTETDTDIRANFKLVTIDRPPRTFSKLRLINALMTRNLWLGVRDWLDTSGYYDIFVAAQDFREDHPQFAAGLNAAKSRFSITDDEIAAILAESVLV